MVLSALPKMHPRGGLHPSSCSFPTPTLPFRRTDLPTRARCVGWHRHGGRILSRGSATEADMAICFPEMMRWGRVLKIWKTSLSGVSSVDVGRGRTAASGRRATPNPGPPGLAADRMGMLEPGTPGPPAEPFALVGLDRAAAQCTGHRSHRGGRTRRQTARVGSARQPLTGGLGRCGAPEPGPWPATRPTSRLGWPRFRAQDLLTWPP